MDSIIATKLGLRIEAKTLFATRSRFPVENRRIARRVVAAASELLREVNNVAIIARMSSVVERTSHCGSGRRGSGRRGGGCRRFLRCRGGACRRRRRFRHGGRLRRDGCRRPLLGVIATTSHQG